MPAHRRPRRPPASPAPALEAALRLTVDARALLIGTDECPGCGQPVPTGHRTRHAVGCGTLRALAFDHAAHDARHLTPDVH